MEISKEEIVHMVQEAYLEGFNSAIECLLSAKDGVVQTFAAHCVQPTCATCGDTGRANPTLSEPDGVICPDCGRSG